MTRVLEANAKEGIWQVRFIGNERSGTMQWFGTDTLPTPFTLNMPKDKAMQILREAGEGEVVSLE